MFTTKLLVLVSMVSALLFGCNHNMRTDKQPAAVPAPACIDVRDSSSAKMKKMQDDMDRAEASLYLYRAVSDLYAYVKNEGDPQSSPEELIQKVRDFRNTHPVDARLANQADDLVDEARVRYAKFAVSNLRNFTESKFSIQPTAKDAITEATNAVGRIIGTPEVTDLLKQLTELGKKARLAYAKNMVQYLEDCVNGKYPLLDSIVTTEVAIVYALREGDDVSPLVARMAAAILELRRRERNK